MFQGNDHCEGREVGGEENLVLFMIVEGQDYREDLP